MDCRTIFPFALKRDGRTLSPTEAGAVYRALNAEVEMFARDSAQALPVHLGQPVTVGPSGALRVSLSARLVADAYVADDAPESERHLTKTITAMTDAIGRAALAARTI